jgi:hypothetical protein
MRGGMYRILSGILLVATACLWCARSASAQVISAGFDFRSTSGFVTDASTNSPELGSTYPHTYTNAAGTSLVAGWNNGGVNCENGVVLANRNAGTDPRLAGLATPMNGNAGDGSHHNFQCRFRVDLPVTGNWAIRLAAGDFSFATNNYVQFADNGVVFATYAAVAPGANQFMDATGVVYSNANWLTMNSSLSHVFTSTLFEVIMGPNVFGPSGFSTIAHLFLSGGGAPNSGGQIISGPMLPQFTPSVAYPSEAGYPAPTAVASGANLQMAITAAGCGTILSLAHGGSWSTATFYSLPNTACACHTDPTKWVIIRSDAYVGGSTRGMRIDPSTEYANLAYIVSTDTNYAFSAADNGTSCYWFGPGLDVNENAGNYEGILQWGDVSSTNWAHDMVWDHSYAHGRPSTPLIHCIGLNGQYEAVVDSYISDCKQIGQDTQAISSRDGPGGVLIQNNFLEGAGENLLIGGGDSQVNTLESDWTFKNNHFFKPLSWRPGDPSYAGGSSGAVWVVKNIFEIKDVARALIVGNVMENNWGGGQNGVADVFDACNQGGTQTHGTIQDVTMYYNLLRHAAGVGNIAGCGGGPISYPDHRMQFHDNLAWDIDECLWATCGGSRSWIVSPQVGTPIDPYDIWWNHETVSSANQSAGLLFSGNAMVDFSYGIQFGNSIINNNEVSGALVGNGGSVGNNLVTNFTPGANYTNDCLIGDNSAFYTFSNFNGDKFPANEAAVYVAPGSDFHVAASSVCHLAASDGLDMGANIDAVNAATAGVVQTLGNLHTVTNVSPSTFTHLGSTSITITGTNFLNESGLGVIIGGAGPTSAISTDSCGFNNPGQYTITAFTDTSHFTYTGGCVVVMTTPVTVALNDTINKIVNSAKTTGTINRYSPGNACTSVVVVSPTSITCNTPAASGPVTTGPVSVFVSQWGIPVQSPVYGNYN